MVDGRQIGVIKSASLQCLVRHGPKRPRYRIQIAGFATDHHRAYSFHWLPVTSRMHDATIRCTASAILATLPRWNTNAFSFIVPRISIDRDFQNWSNLRFSFPVPSATVTLVYFQFVHLYTYITKKRSNWHVNSLGANR